MLNSTIVANINGNIAPGQKISSGLHSSLLMSDVDFAVTEVKRNQPSNEQQTFIQKLGRKGSPNMVFNGYGKGVSYLDNNRNPQSKPSKIVNGNKNGMEATDEEGPSPKVCLYLGKISSEWQQSHKIGAGLVNLGNTCFMNTVLQCLTYCPPLTNYLLHDSDHVLNCKITGFCMMCELQRHIKRVINRPGDIVKPVHIYQKLKSIAKHFQFGRQEDAHEFLRYVIENMWKSCIANYEGHTKLDSASKETTVINKIFGGYHRSQVTCLRCKEKNNTYDHFMDFILDVKQNVISLEKALEKFIQPELLQNDNAYKCMHCKIKVSAQKKFTIHVAPNVATFQFKRFDYNRMCGGKITKHISYPDTLNLRPYMSNPKGSPIWYRLNAVLVHLGTTCNSGHYYCFVRNANGFWYIMDDTRVQQVSLNQVLNQVAYVLFYVRTSPSENTSAKRPVESVTSSLKNNQYVKNGFIGSSSYSVSPNSLNRPSLNSKSSALPPISKLSVSSQSDIPNHTSPNNVYQKRALQPLSQNRDKVAFSIGSCKSPNMLPKTPAPHSQGSSILGSQENSVKKESPLAKGLMNGNLLVPYIEDSSEDSEDEARNISDKCTKKCVPSPCPNSNKATTSAQDTALTRNGHLEADDTGIMSSPCIIMDIKAKSRCASSFLVDSAKYHNSTSNVRTAFPMKRPSCSTPELQKSLNCPILPCAPRRENTPKKDSCSQEPKFCGSSETKMDLDVVDESRGKTGSTICNLNRIVESNPSISTANKVNATTQWNVVDVSVRSPSIASGSSTNSVNSTTEWKVTDADSSSRGKSGKKSQVWARQMKPVSKYPTEIKAGTESKPQKPLSSLPEIVTPTKTPSPSCKQENASNSACFRNGNMPSLKPVQNLNKCSEVACKSSDIENTTPVRKKPEGLNGEDSKNQIFLVQGQKPFQDLAFQSKPSHSFLESAQNGEAASDRRNFKTQTPSSAKRCFSHAPENSCEEWASRLPNHNEDSHGSMPEKLPTDVTKSKRRKGSEVMEDRTPPQNSCSRNSDRELTEIPLPKTVKKNTKCRSYDRTDNRQIDSKKASESSEPYPGESHRKTWTHTDKSPTKHKNRHSHSILNCDTQMTSNKSKKQPHSDSEESVGRASSSSKSSFEYVWVEKTKETMETEKATTEAKPAHNNVQHLPLDNSLNHDVVSELQKYSHRNLSLNVGTWDNGNSRTFDDNFSRSSRRYDYDDEYDDEFDRGKVRKRHQFREEYRSHFSFQDGLRMKNAQRPPFRNKWQPRRFFHNRRNWGHPYGGQNQNGHGHFRKMYRNKHPPFHRR